MKFTGERQIGKNFNEIEKLHQERYEWASKRIRGNKILDCACGIGYGSKIIIKNHLKVKVSAVDISKEAIEHAKKYFNSSRIKYLIQDMTELNLNEKFDTIISLESIEHVENPKIVLNKFKKMLKNKGNIIVSLPSRPTLKENKFHKFEIKNMEEGIEFFESCGFEVIDFLNQDGRYGLFNLILKKRLEVGCGNKPKEGYEHLDIRKLAHVEICSPAWNIPKKDNYYDEVYSRHSFEHYSYSKAVKSLKSFKRILKRGGKLNLILPDIEFHLKQ